MLLLLQMDITARVEMEMRMAALTETQLTMLEQVGPGLINILHIPTPGPHKPGQLLPLSTSRTDTTTPPCPSPKSQHPSKP